MTPTRNQICCLADRILVPDGWLLADQELWRVLSSRHLVAAAVRRNETATPAGSVGGMPLVPGDNAR